MQTTRELILQTAAALFMEHGYGSVSLRRIADAVGVRVPSLYSHFPGGKEQIYVEAALRALEHFRVGLEAAARSSPDLAEALEAAADWLLAQPPMDLVRMVRTDLLSLSHEHRELLTRQAFECTVRPLTRRVQEAAYQGQVNPRAVGLLPPVFLVSVESLPEGARYSGVSPAELARGVVWLLLEGARPRGSSA